MMTGEEIRYAAVRQWDDFFSGSQTPVEVRETSETVLEFVLGFLVILACCKLGVGTEFSAL